MSASHPSTTVGNASRNASLLALVILWVASFAARPARAQGTGSSKFHVDSQRLQGTLEKLSEFGRNPEGGVTRIGFSETDMAARECRRRTDLVVVRLVLGRGFLFMTGGLRAPGQ
jgi:hypothetical protein